MKTDPVICPQCEQPGAEPYEVRYEKSYKIIAFRCGWCGDDWTETTRENLPPHLIGSDVERISNAHDPEPESLATKPIICPTCREPAALPEQMHYYKSYNIVPFHCGACGLGGSVSTRTLPPRSDWLKAAAIRNQPDPEPEPARDGGTAFLSEGT